MMGEYHVCRDKYRKDKESKEDEIVRDIAIKAQVQMGADNLQPTTAD